MIQFDPRCILLAIGILSAAASCSRSPAPEDPKVSAAASTPRKSADGSVPIRPSPLIAPASAAGTTREASAITEKRDIKFKGQPGCKIDFVYAGFDPEDLYWDGENCAVVTAKLVDRAELQRLGKWQRLDSSEQRHIEALPGGMVLYVEGQYTASIYPVGTTRLSYEVSVAD